MPTSLGLSQKEAEQRLQTHGPNCLPVPKQMSFALVFLSQFKSPFIYVLLAAAAVSFILGQMNHTSAGTHIK